MLDTGGRQPINLPLPVVIPSGQAGHSTIPIGLKCNCKSIVTIQFFSFYPSLFG